MFISLSNSSALHSFFTDYDEHNGVPHPPPPVAGDGMPQTPPPGGPPPPPPPVP
uniref:Uncharacterized protein n=1 Tax=Amphimedon queenslandica TaxID=400682 RepID=A0A1X7UE08_AMPQE